jgi:hypothetical protein
MDGSSVVLHTRFSSVVFPAFALPITRIRKRVYLARSFAASSSGSIVTAGGGKRLAEQQRLKANSSGSETYSPRSKSESFLQSIANSFGPFGSLLAIFSHLDECRRQEEPRLRAERVTDHIGCYLSCMLSARHLRHPKLVTLLLTISTYSIAPKTCEDVARLN